jgi:hypothetical protein
LVVFENGSNIKTGIYGILFEGLKLNITCVPSFVIFQSFESRPSLRERLNSFKKSGIWPVSFKQVRRKIKEYGKKNKKDLGLDSLEFQGDPDSEDSNDYKDEVDQSNPIPNPVLQEEYQLPPLPKPASYSDCVFQFKELDSKIKDILSSPSRRKYQVVQKSTDKWLMQGSLSAQELLNARKAQVDLHKSKLNARMSLSKGGNMLAIDGLEKKKMLKRKYADDAVKKQKTKIRQYENKAKRELYKAGVKARREEKARLRFLSNNQGILGAYIPIISQEPIQDPKRIRFRKRSRQFVLEG